MEVVEIKEQNAEVTGSELVRVGKGSKSRIREVRLPLLLWPSLERFETGPKEERKEVLIGRGAPETAQKELNGRKQ